MSFFKKISKEIKLEDRDATIHIHPVPMSKMHTLYDLQAQFNKFNKVNRTTEPDTDEAKTALQSLLGLMSKAIVEYSDIPSVEDVEELTTGEIGYIYGQIIAFSNDPKAKAPTGQAMTTQS